MEQGLSFHQQLRYERERRGWSQADLAGKVNSDFKTVHRWESGKSLPRPYYRQIICELFGKSAEELGLIENGNDSAFIAHASYREDWGEAALGGNFYGRDNELLQLKEWIGDQGCQVIALLGIGGIGKTMLAVKIAEHMKNDFEYVFWRSLQNTPSVEYLLKQCIQCLSGQQHLDLLDSFNEQLLSLVECLRRHHCLLVLDNVESIMQEGRHDSHYCHGYESYGRLIQCVAEVQHQSCLLLTSREKPKEIALLEGRTSPVRTLYLRGIECNEGRAILKDKGLLGSDQQWRTLVDLYSGNPLALKLVSDTIREVFGGDIERFLWEEEITFGYIDDLIGQQFYRLSMQEREILYWLAIERQAVPLENICDNLVQPVVKGTIFAALDSLLRRSFVEARNSSQFMLQPVILEYVTNDFIKRACEEFVADRKDIWVNYVFAKAQSENYIRESQERLIVAPIAQRLLSTLGRETVRRNLESLLVAQRQKYPLERNYVASNVLQLFMYLGHDLRDVDFSYLVVWQAYLQDTILQRVNFAYAHFISSVFKNTFGNVLSVAFSPLENVFAMGTAAGEVWMYQALSGTAFTNYLGHTDGVWSVAFHPNGHMLASSSDDQTIRLWDIETGHCIRVLREHTNRVRSVTFSPDGQILASGSDDQTIRLWNVSNGSCFLVLQGHTDRVWSVAFSPDGRTLATGSTDKTIRLWDVSTGHCFKELTNHTGWVRSVIFSPKGEILASGSDDQTVRLWDSTDGSCLHALQGHINRVWSIAFSPDGNTLASGGEDKSIRLWDVKTGTCLKTLQEHIHGVRSIAMSFSGQMLVSGGDDQTVRTWELHTGVCLKTLRGYTNRIWSVAFDPKGDTVVSSSEDQSLRLWNVTDATCCKVFQSHLHGAKAAIFSPDGTLIASGGEDQIVRVRDVHTGRLIRNFVGHTNWVRAIAFSPDGQMLASGSEDQMVRLWHINMAQCLSTLQGHTSWIRSVAFSPDGTALASGSDDQTIRIWHTPTGRCLHVLQDHTGRLRTVAFSPDGKILASGSEDQTIRLWDTMTGYCLNILRHHTSWVRAVTFSPDGKLLASCGDDQTIHLWDIATQCCSSILRGHTSRIRSLVFHPREPLLASGSDDGTIKLWHIHTYDCVKTLIDEKPYESMNIIGATGLTEAQKDALRSLGAVDEV